MPEPETWPEEMHCEYPTKNFEFIINSLGDVSCMGDPHIGILEIGMRLK